MASFLHVLKNNRNYRYTWMGQVVSEIGDHFNNIAVFSLVLANTHSGLAVSGVMLSRAVPASIMESASLPHPPSASASDSIAARLICRSARRWRP